VKAVLWSAGTGYVAVWIYKSRKEARLAAKVFPRQYSARLRRMYRPIYAVNVLVVVFVVDRAGSRALQEARAAMADLKHI
jgi:hypothetical protein